MKRGSRKWCATTTIRSERGRWHSVNSRLWSGRGVGESDVPWDVIRLTLEIFINTVLTFLSTHYRPVFSLIRELDPMSQGGLRKV